MSIIRVGAVGHLNARPLVYGLDRQPDRFTLRYEAPSKCASLLHEGAIDLGLISPIEYLERTDYRILPDVAIASSGPVASAGIFTTRPVTAIRSIAVDNTARSSAALLRVLCAQWFDVEPKFVTLQPDLATMLKRCDAALLIGDAALFEDHETAGLDKIDLGEEWTAMTSLPFVWAFWAGRPQIGSPAVTAAFQTARDAGVAAIETIAREHCHKDPEQMEQGLSYLRDNIRYVLGEQETAGLRKFLDACADLRIVPNGGVLRYYGDA